MTRKVSAQRRDDVRRLFQQMAFNAAFGNTDDHLKNFWMVHDATGYRLSPAFDLLPNVGERREHVLMFEYDFSPPARAQSLAVASRWAVDDAAALLDAVVASVARFAAVAKRHAVPQANIDEVAADIARRLALLAAPRSRQRAASAPR